MNGLLQKTFIRNKPLCLVAWAVFSYNKEKLMLVIKQGDDCYDNHCESQKLI